MNASGIEMQDSGCCILTRTGQFTVNTHVPILMFTFVEHTCQLSHPFTAGKGRSSPKTVLKVSYMLSYKLTNQNNPVSDFERSYC